MRNILLARELFPAENFASSWFTNNDTKMKERNEQMGPVTILISAKGSNVY